MKLSVLTVANQSGRPRRLSVTAYAEWVLGTSRGTGAPWIITESEPATKAVLATNPWNAEFRGRVAFLDMGGRQTAWTADRTEFLGRNGGPERPAGLARGHELQQTDGAGLDPCAVLQTSITLAAGESTEIVVALGQAATRRGGNRTHPGRPRHRPQRDAGGDRAKVGRRPRDDPGQNAGPRDSTS